MYKSIRSEQQIGKYRLCEYKVKIEKKTTETKDMPMALRFLYKDKGK